MAERGIIFSAPMVRALLEGRKTQTRRLAKGLPDPGLVWKHAGIDYGIRLNNERRWEYTGPIWAIRSVCDGRVPPIRVQHAVGDRLYVRENFQLLSFGDYEPTKFCPADVRYAATDRLADSAIDVRGYPWRPCIHMPRWASRITLLVTEVRVQRLQDISDSEACAEGVEMESADPPFYYVPGIWPHSLTAIGIEEPGGHHAKRSYAKLWGMLHDKPGERWNDNPWIVAYTFTVEKRNIDAKP